MEGEPPVSIKTRKKREMTPELLDKLKHARERASELRASAKEAKSKLPDNIPEKEKTKVAQYLTTRKAIKEKIKQEVLNEIEEIPLKDSKGFTLPTPKEEAPPLPKPSIVEIKAPVVEAPAPPPKKKKEPEPETDSDDEYTTIKIPKKKIMKWKKRNEQPLPEPEPEKPQVRKTFNTYTTQHLINLAKGGYNF